LAEIHANRDATCSDLEESLERLAIRVLITFRGGGWRIAAMLRAVMQRARCKAKFNAKRLSRVAQRWNFLRRAIKVSQSRIFTFPPRSCLIDRISRQVDGNDLQRLSSSRLEFDHRASNRLETSEIDFRSPLTGSVNKQKIRSEPLTSV
jgi:hypothetical protein